MASLVVTEDPMGSHNGAAEVFGEEVKLTVPCGIYV